MAEELQKNKIFWTRKMNIKLVKFIESKTYIWNAKHPKYTSVLLRDQTYAKFAEKYGNDFTKEAVKQRWTNIRSTFSHYLRKYKAAQAAGEECFVQWHLWEACQFLCQSNEPYSRRKNQNPCLDSKKSKEKSQSSDSEDSLQLSHNDKCQISQVNCKELSQQLVEVFKNVQNDAFGLDNSKYANVGRAVATKLSKLSSLKADQVCNKITEILLFYNDGNPKNEIVKSKAKSDIGTMLM